MRQNKIKFTNIFRASNNPYINLVGQKGRKVQGICTKHFQQILLEDYQSRILCGMLPRIYLPEPCMQKTLTPHTSSDYKSQNTHDIEDDMRIGDGHIPKSV